MRVPYSWLKELVDFEWDIRELADRLTFSGLEVETIDTIGSDYSGVVVGEVLEIMPHPNADKLVLVRVGTGESECRVVCGARNFKQGDKAPLAIVGAVLPNGMKVKSTRIRGEKSDGMLCAEDELGLSDDHEGIMILPSDLEPGTPVSDMLGGPEQVLVIEVTPNRPDCLCILGVAREVAALCGSALKIPSADVSGKGGDVNEHASVTVEDPEGCPRYTARVISDVTVGRSPYWMQQRLRQCGIRPINNMVDITNYVMMECGQPLHAFDTRFVKDSSIIVRRADEGERIVTLDEIERRLDPEILVIADPSGPVAVAGVMGGEHSGILPDTTSVLLESASFAPVLVRSGSRKLGLSSESAYRFERGVDPELAEWAGRRAISLMAELGGGAVCKGVIDVYAGSPAPREIKLDFVTPRALLGVDIPGDEMVSILESLELDVSGVTGKGCVVRPPSFRNDLENEADLCEEIIRIYGLDRIPVRDPNGRIVSDADDSEYSASMLCRNRLVESGLTEIVNYSFLSENLLDSFFPEHRGERVMLPNPISADHSVLRDSLVPQMVETLGRNRSRQTDRAALFEMGRVFFKNPDGSLGEESRIVGGLMGCLGPALSTGGRSADLEVFLQLKGVIERAMKAMRISAVVPGGDENKGWLLVPASSAGDTTSFPVSSFEKGKGFGIVIDNVLQGVAGIVRKDIAGEWRIVDPVAVFEVRTAPLLSGVFGVPQAQPLPAFPSVERDIAVVVEESLNHEEIVSAVQRLAPKELTCIKLFDIYRSDDLGNGKKSLAYSLTYRSLDRTLTDEEVNKLHESVKQGLKDVLSGVDIREG